MNSELILKHLSGQTTAEEIEQLTSWVNESAENENQFAEMQNSYIFLASTLSPDNKKSAFKEIINKINNKKEKKEISVKRIYSIAASILLPVYWVDLPGFTNGHQAATSPNFSPK